jgi:hypothetical protein
VGFIKVSVKPLKASLATWASKWVYLFTHYLQVRGYAEASFWDWGRQQTNSNPVGYKESAC